jgi:hypothetical protein
MVRRQTFMVNLPIDFANAKSRLTEFVINRVCTHRMVRRQTFMVNLPIDFANAKVTSVDTISHFQK